ncbi:MAG: hypothetical protein PHY09_03845 [Desulfuromonadaceae bacterium]|nr:hypothetical protein [Desulfuromonadaceae bacterium]MDD5106695.1 hypothetical protein [Desulfuromonadaceae bacterium]
MAQITDETTEAVTVTAEAASDADEATPLQPESNGSGSTDVPADTTDFGSEDSATSAALPHEEKPARVEADRSEDIPNLLGGTVGSDAEADDAVPDREDAGEIAAPVENSVAKPSDDPTDAGMPDESTPAPEAPPEPAPLEPACRASLDEIRSALTSVQSSLVGTHARIDAVTHGSEALVGSINNLSTSHQMLIAQLDASSSEAGTKSVLSKTFLIIASALVSLLAIFQLVTFYSLSKVVRQQKVVGATIFKNMTSLDKKMAAYDKNLTTALANDAAREQARATAEAAGHAAAENVSVHGAAGPAIPVAEKINRLRNGLPEKKLIRKETGDWFAYDKKGNEIIAESDVIQVLNDAYRRIGRTMDTKVPMPPHNALCILKPDGRGGTLVEMTKDFLP